MNTNSFKERQLLFQGGGNKTNPPKERQSLPLINKDMFEPKAKNNNSNKNLVQEDKILKKKSNDILKLANQIGNKIKTKNEEDSTKKKQVQPDNKNNLNNSKSDIKQNLNKSLKNDKKEENDKKGSDIKKDNEKKIEKKESEKNDKDKTKENIKESKPNKIEELKKQMEKGLKKEGESKDIKKDDKENKNKNVEIKKDNKKNEKINEISKKFEKEIKKEDKSKVNNIFNKDNNNKDMKNEDKNKLDNSVRKESYNSIPIKDFVIIPEVRNESYSKEINNTKKINENKTDNKNVKNKDNNIDNNINDNPQINLTKKKDPKILPNKGKEENKNISRLYSELYEDVPNSNENHKDSINNNKKIKNLEDLEIDNFKDFNEEDYLERKYDKSTIDKGKIFFKYRYLKNKYTQINETIKRLSTVNPNDIKNIPNNKRLSTINTTGLTFSASNINNLNNLKKRNSINPNDSKFKLSNNIHLSFFIQNPSAQCKNSIDKDSELRHYHSQFLQLTEKSILCFNLKKYDESYLYLFSNNIIKNLEEFGEFLLVVNGFDKFIIGDFLSNINSPNDKKEVLNGFVNAIKMKYEEIGFIDCFRFFMKRLYLPKDANLILEIMNAFSDIYFKNNKNNENFVNIYKNVNNIYLLISTVLALNTMFTRKDIKNINKIKKDEFLSMNKDIQESELIKIYDQLEKKPFSIENENYNENVYKRMSTLAKEKISSSPLSNTNSLIKSKTINMNNIKLDLEDEENNYVINEQDSDEEYDENNIINTDTKASIPGGGRSITRASFSLTKNLYSFTKQDQEILNKVQKFYKFIGNDSLHQREFLIYDNFTKLIWGKNVDENKVKGNLHFLNITEIIDVFNGIEHSEIIKKYIKANPKELKEKNHYITIISTKRQINLKSDSLQTALLWYKALKSLVLKMKNQSLKRNSKSLNEINTQFKLHIEELWKDFIFPKWNIYGNYILTKLGKKNDDVQDKKILNNTKNIDTIIKDIGNDKILEYPDFFLFYYLGLPSFCRGTIWRLLIGNPCGLTETLYESFSQQVEEENFNTFDVKYHEDINTIFNIEYNINQMITDIIKTKDLFLSELVKFKIDQEQIMKESYKILRVFFLMRNDIVYKKSIVSLIFVFLMVEENEYNAFCNVYNIICNSFILKFYIGDEDFIKKNTDFFSSLVKKYLPKIHEHFTNLEISHELYFIPWVTEVFSSSLSYKLLLRVLDLYLINGEYVIFQIGLCILSVQEDDLLDLTISEIFKLLKKLSSKYNEDFFLDKMKNYFSIKEDYNIWKKENDLGIQKLKLFQAIFNDDK